jgi:hypothetical protein
MRQQEILLGSGFYIVQGSQTKIGWRATFYKKNAIYKKNPQNKLNFIKHYVLVFFLRCSRAVQMHLAGREFETTDLLMEVERRKWSILSLAKPC